MATRAKTQELTTNEIKKRGAVCSIQRCIMYWLFFMSALTLLLNHDSWAALPTPAATPSSADSFLGMVGQSNMLAVQESELRDKAFFLDQVISILTQLMIVDKQVRQL